jgi:hypothetical protein
MLQHLLFEDEVEARRPSDKLLAIGLLDDVARAGVFGDFGLGGQPVAGRRANRGARRSRGLGGSGEGGGGGVCLLAGRHGGFVCLRMVSHVAYSAPAVTLLNSPIRFVVLQKAVRIAGDLQEDVIWVDEWKRASW